MGASHANWRSLYRSTNILKKDELAGEAFFWSKKMAKKTYYEKLKDPRWQKKRLEVMHYAHFCCEVCGDNESTLNVHHKEYFRNVEPWDYENNQLSVLCENCHEHHHDSFDILKWTCSQANLDGLNNREELALILAGYMGFEYQDILAIAKLDDAKIYKKYFISGVLAKEFNHG